MMEIELIERGTPTDHPSLLFVHGAFHDARCWDEHMLPWFADRGWHACALSLRGHGNSPGDVQTDDISLSDFLDDILTCIDRINGPVILIGHSMGGGLCELTYDKHPAVKGVCFVAPSPRRPAASVVLRILATHPIKLIRGQFFGDDDALRDVFIDSFFPPDMPTQDRLRAEGMVSYESRPAMSELFGRKPPEPKKIPAMPFMIIGGADDWSIPVHKFKPLVQAFDAPLHIVPGAHDLMLDPRWEQTATCLHVWLNSQFN